jgi:hypothetical protein
MFREVQLKAPFASRYPALEPGRWYTAAAVAGLIKGMRILSEGPQVQFVERIVDPSHFEFRGGARRQGCWMGLRTRRIDRHPVLPHERGPHRMIG